ncbi:MAG: S16 family serine protease [Ilumatobacteraceae bacterium]
MVRAPAARNRAWAVPLAVLGLSLAVAPLVFSFLPSSAFVDKTHCNKYDDTPAQECIDSEQQAVRYALVPADAEPVEPRLNITGVPTYDTAGQIYFVTITEPPITMLDWFVTRDNDAARFRSEQEKNPNTESRQTIIQAGQRQMRTAKDNAIYVALKAAGLPVEITQGEVIVDYLLCLEANEEQTQCLEYSPADELLDSGDVLKKVNGEELQIVDDVSRALKGVEPGEKVEVEFERNGEPMSGEVETIASPGEEPQRTIIGFRPIDTTTVTLPDGLNIDIDTDTIGGPSAGLAFTLTLIDELTDGDLMGGKKVAVTGTIDFEGNVGAIGGLNSKASAVRQVGVQYFIVPASQDGQQYPDNIQGALDAVDGEVEIIPVATLQEALDALVRIGGDPVQLADLPDS